MNYKFFTLPFLAVLISTGCQSGQTNIPVSRDSEAGQAISKLDDTERQYNKNVVAYTKAMMDYEQAHGGTCGNIFFSSLSQPIKVVAPRVHICTLQGSSSGCGHQDYKVKVTYEDDACSIVNGVEVLEKMAQ
jgi:hypothetical protein